MAELLTEKQMLRRQRDRRVASAFSQMREQYPTASINLILVELAKNCRYGIGSTAGIRAALIRQGMITPEKR